MTELSDKTAVVVGASRGFGRGIAGAFADAGAQVVAVARGGAELAELSTASPNIRAEVADAADPTAAWNLLDRYQPQTSCCVAGANPVTRPLQHQTWETFSVNWNMDVKIAFTWLREACSSRFRRAVESWWSERCRHRRIAGQRRIRRGKGHPGFIAGYAQDEADGRPLTSASRR